MPNRPSCRLSMESLEDRTVPAALTGGALPTPVTSQSGTGHVHHVAVDLPKTGPNLDLVLVSGDANTRFVQKLYFDFLGRGIDNAAQGYIDSLSGGHASRRDIAESILGSEEYGRRQINAMYKSFLGRGADQEGLAGYVHGFTDGQSLDDIAVDLLASDEYRDQHPGTSQLVAALYDDVLGRTPDSLSALNYGQRLDSGDARDVVEEIVTSTESRRMAGETAVELMFNQKPTASVGASAVADAVAGKPIAEVLADLAASEQYFSISEVK